MVHWWILCGKWRWWMFCWVCTINPFGSNSSSTFNFGYLSPTSPTTHSGASILTNGRTANIYMNSRQTFGGVQDFEMLGQQCRFLIPADKIKNRSFFPQKLLDTTLLPPASSITTIPEHSELDSQKAKGNHLADLSAKYTALQRFRDQNLCHGPKELTSRW